MGWGGYKLNSELLSKETVMPWQYRVCGNKMPLSLSFEAIHTLPQPL
jgi:hypothetical protein